MKTMSAIVINQGNQQCEADDEQLLPGIPNEVVLDHITSKLPWRVFYSLKLVSRGWHHAIQSRQVYDARVRSNSTEIFIFVKYFSFENDYRLREIGLWSMRDESVIWKPPQIPGLARGINHWQYSQLIALDGRMYILGGAVHKGVCASRKVYVLDMAGQGSWKECAGMLEPRRDFGCGVKNGKIYVFGGLRRINPPIIVNGAEVYDPKCNSWSPVTSTKSLRCHHEVAVVGEELFLYGGVIVVKHEDYHEPNRIRSNIVEIYHPGKDEWRVVSIFRDQGGRIFTTQGNLYSMSDLFVRACDFDRNSWPLSHGHSYAEMEPVSFLSGGVSYLVPVESLSVDPVCVVPVDDELLALVKFTCVFGDSERSVSGLIRSEGLGSEKRKLLWRHQKGSLEGFDLCSICPIKL